MAKAAVQKSSKINFYKFVNVKEPPSDLEKKNPSEYATTVSINKSTEAINNLGATINGMAGIVADLKKIELERLEDLNKNKPKMDPKYGKTKKGSIMGSVAKGLLKKGGGFLAGLLGLLGNLLKGLLILPALSWLSKEENQDKVVKIIEVIGTIGKFIFDWAKFGITQTIDGLYSILSDDTSWWEKTIGFGKAIIGIGSLFLGLRWLTNPVKLAKDITRAVTTLVRILTKGGGRRMGGKGKGGSLKKLALGIGATVVTGVAINKLTESKEDSGDDKKEEKAKGGVVKGYSKGGWIQGPQSGYPVSLDGGKSTSFIGHGTEYVSMKSAGGQAFVTPYDTPATRKNPGLTAMRQAEAQRLGYAEGGEVSLKLNRKQFDALAFITAGEAQRNTNDEYGVAAAVLNRVADPRYPNTVQKVISAPGQYEAYNHGAKNDKALADKFVSIQGQLNIIKALNKLEGRTDFKGTSMYKHMGATDIKFSPKGNFYHYPEQRKKTDPKPDNIPTHYKKLISGDPVKAGELKSTGPGGYVPGETHTADGDPQQGGTGFPMGIFNKFLGAIRGIGLFDAGGETDRNGNPKDPKMLERLKRSHQGMKNGIKMMASGGQLDKLDFAKGAKRADTPEGMCVAGVIYTGEKNSAKIGDPEVSGGIDPGNHPRGLMAWAVKKGYGSIPGTKGRKRNIKGAFGNFGVTSMTESQWGDSVVEGKIPSGALIFNTRHGWDWNKGSSGNDAAIAQNGGAALWSGHWQSNFQHKGKTVGAVYSDVKEIVALTHPQGNTKEHDGLTSSPDDNTTTSPGSPSGNTSSSNSAVKLINTLGLGKPSSSMSIEDRMGAGVSSQFGSALSDTSALAKATSDRNESRKQFKDGVNNAVMTAATTVRSSNAVTANAVNQAQEGIAGASGGGGGDSPSVNSLPGIGTVNINGVLKSTAYALNSNNNFMRGLLR